MSQFLWCMMPSDLIRKSYLLSEISWRESKGNATAALMVYIALALKGDVHPNDNPKPLWVYARATYDDLQEMTQLSRSMVAKGIRLLEEKKLVDVGHSSTGNAYFLNGNLDSGWTKLPRSKFLEKGATSITPFKGLSLRSKHELNALKLYLLFLVMRNSKTGAAAIGYDKISDYTGILREDIARGVSHLINLGLVTVTTDADSFVHRGYEGRYNRYRIGGL